MSVTLDTTTNRFNVNRLFNHYSNSAIINDKRVFCYLVQYTDETVTIVWKICQEMIKSLQEQHKDRFGSYSDKLFVYSVHKDYTITKDIIKLLAKQIDKYIEITGLDLNITVTEYPSEGLFKTQNSSIIHDDTINHPVKIHFDFKGKEINLNVMYSFLKLIRMVLVYRKEFDFFKDVDVYNFVSSTGPFSSSFAKTIQKYMLVVNNPERYLYYADYVKNPLEEATLNEMYDNFLKEYNMKNTMLESKEKLFVRSRHPTHKALRNLKVPFKAVIRLGSTTALDKDKNSVIINTPQAVANSASKLRMKRQFDHAGNINHASWTELTTVEELQNWIDDHDFNNDQRFVIKSEYGSRNVGNTLCTSIGDLLRRAQNKQNRNYIVEVYYPYTREYRLHVTKNGCFYTCRKMLRRDSEDTWFRNDSNCVWIREENPAFDKPINWDDIVAHCINALNAVGLDIGAIDVRVQSAKKKNPRFVILETNSAPSFGDITAQKYQEVLPQLVNQKKCVD